MADGLSEKVRSAFGDRGAEAVAALVRRDVLRRSVRYIVADDDGEVVGTARLAIAQEATQDGLWPLAREIGWLHALRGALVLGLLSHAALDEDEAYVEEFAVRADRRREGIGRMLLAACEEAARSEGRLRTTLWVSEANAAALALYRSGGYRVTRRHATLRGRIMYRMPAALLMEKSLGGAG